MTPSVKQFIALDYYTIKPYITWKNFLIYFGIAATIGISTKNPYAVSGVVLFSGMIYTRFLFAVGEQNGIDVLYCTLPLIRRQVVLGRYIFTMMLNVLFSLGGAIVSTLFAVFFAGGFSLHLLGESFLASGVMMVIYTIVLLIQLPIFFKLGYKKGNTAGTIVLFIPMLLIFFIVQGAAKYQWLQSSLVLKTLGITAGMVAVSSPWISCRLSEKWYKQREF
ncbi:MAG: ABC-2 transporter permease [Clostridiales bacterium]|nr:ABC-2 transporter permease [Clostridiales bacterium]